VPSGASRMLENLLAAGALRRTPRGGSFSAPQALSWWGGGWLPLPPRTQPRSPSFRNRRPGPSQHDGMDPSMVFCRRSIASPLQRTDLTDVVLLGIIICLRCPLFHSFYVFGSVR